MTTFGTSSNLGLQKRLRRFAAVPTPITPVSKTFQSSVVESYQSPLPATAGVAGLNAINTTNIEVKGLSDSSSCSVTSLDNQVSTYPNLSMPWANKAHFASLQTINSASPEATKALDTIQANSLLGVDLAPYAPLGWDAPLIVTTIPGSHINGQAVTTADTPIYYVSFINGGYYAVIDRFKYTLSIDGIISVTWPMNQAVFSGVSVQSVIQGPPLSAGTHQASLTVDSENTVQETNENNNVYNYVFTVLGTTPPPTLSINDISINEASSGVSIATFTITLSAVATSNVTVNYATANGTGSSAAVAPSDYTSNSGSLTFTPGQTSKTISVTIIGDTVVEPNETFFVNLSGATNATIADNQGMGTILDDDSTPPAITVVATDANAAETLAGATANPGVYTLTRSVVTASPLTVNVSMSGAAINGTDYASIPTTVIFEANSSTAIVSLTPIDDTLLEQTESASLTIGAGTGYTIGTAASATATIADNDLGSIAIAKTTDGNETGPLASVFTLTRTGSTAAALNVSYTLGGAATRGLDYTGTSPGTATFAAGSTATTINLPTINDVLVDPNETIIATITAPTGYIISGSASATATISDNDPVGQSIVTVASDYSGVSENGTPNLIYSFTRSGATAGGLAVNFTVGGTATQGSDFLASGAILSGTNGIINFAAGSAIAILTFNPIADTFKEADETVILKLVAGTGYQVGTPTPVTSTIINDDETINQRGTPGNDYIEAGLTVVLSGRSGNDVLIGSRANDILSGGLGSDRLTGGAGSDLFCFSTPQDGSDRITDFNPLEDLIQITAVGFAGGLTAGETLTQPQFSLGAVTAATRFIFNPVSGTLFFDSDGSGSAAPFQLASLNSGLTLTNENIFVS